MEQNKKLKNIIKTTIREVLNEANNVQSTFIKQIKFNGRDLNLYKVSDNPMKVLFYLDTEAGEPYMDINTILPDNMLVDAIWVERDGKEEKVADKLDFLDKTDRTTKSGYNRYVMYMVDEHHS